MSSRPQFSLRGLLFVMVPVCLAAATFHRAPPFEWVNGDQLWEELGLAVRVQAWLRLAGCVVFPAALFAAAVARGGYSRAFCLGATLPAAIAACAWRSIVDLPSSATQNSIRYLVVRSAPVPSGTLASVWRELPLRMLLCLVLPAMLSLGAVEGRGIVRAFCSSGLLPALAPVTAVAASRRARDVRFV